MFKYSKFKFFKKCQLAKEEYLSFIKFENSFWHYKFAYIYLAIFGSLIFFSPLLEIVYNIEPIESTKSLKSLLGSFCLILLFFTLASKKYRNNSFLNNIAIAWWYLCLLLFFPFYNLIFLISSGFQNYAITQLIVSLLILSCFLQSVIFLLFVAIGYIFGCCYYALFIDNHELLVLNTTLMNVVSINFIFIALGMGLAYLREIILKTLMFQTTELEAININLEDLINQRTLEIEENLKLKTDFVNNASHEIRIPLQGILGITEILSGKWQELSEQQRYEYISLINHSCTRLMIFASNLLDFAKFHSGKTRLNAEVNNLSTLIDDTVKDFRSFITSKGITLRIEEEAENIIFLFDKVKIEQIIRNLLSNSLKYSDSNSAISIKVSIKKDIYQNLKNAVEIRFIDEGIGVPETEKEKIFEAFTQSSKSFSNLNSTGLGLALVNEYVKMHKGKIWVENNHPKGSIFIIILPYIDKTNDFSQIKEEGKQNFIASEEVKSSIIYIKDAETNKDNKEKKDKKIDFSNLRGLIVDDEMICLNTTSLMMETLGISMTKEQDGHRAIEAVENSKPDFILLDIMLNGISGVDILKQLKANPTYSHIPIILQSGVVDSNIIKDATNAGAAAHLIKPYSKDQVVTILKKILYSA